MTSAFPTCSAYRTAKDCGTARTCDPTVSRTISALAQDAPAAIDVARAQARTNAWALAGTHAPDAGASRHRPLIIDLDARLVTAHSDKERAAATFKRGYGFHPLWSFVDHGGPAGCPERFGPSTHGLGMCFTRASDLHCCCRSWL